MITFYPKPFLLNIPLLPVILFLVIRGYSLDIIAFAIRSAPRKRGLGTRYVTLHEAMWVFRSSVCKVR